MNQELLWLRLAQRLRALARVPRFSVAIMGSWVLGLTAAITTYSMADGYFFRPPAYVRDPARVLRVWGETVALGGKRVTVTKFSWQQVSALAAAGIPADLASYHVSEQVVVIGDASAALNVAAVSPRYFATFGISPARGVLLDQFTTGRSDLLPIVVTNATWNRYVGGVFDDQRRFVQFRGRTFVIVGIIPDGFSGGESQVIHAWVPLTAVADLIRGSEWRSSPSWWLSLVVHVRPKADLDNVQARIRTVLTRPVSSSRFDAGTLVSVLAQPLRLRTGSNDSAVGRSFGMAAAAGLALLLMASANVGGLFLLRNLSRSHEVVIRQALGASRSDVILELLSEVIVLAIGATLIVAVVLGALSHWLGRAFVPGTNVLPSMLGSRSWAIVLGAALLAIIVGASIAMVGVWSPRSSRGSAREFKGTIGSHQTIVRLAAVAIQVGLTGGLLAGATILALNLAVLRSLDLGVDLSSVVLVTIGRSYSLEHSREVSDLLHRLRKRARSVPHVESASLAITAPFMSGAGVAVNTADHLGVWQIATGVPYLNAVSTNYFRTTRMRVLHGRGFVDTDTTQRVALVNQTFANVAFGGHHAVGQCLFLGADPRNPCFTVVGIVADARRFALVPEDAAMQVYIPLERNPFSDSYPPAVLLVRGTASSEALLGPLIRAVRNEVGPSVDVSVTSFEDIVDPQIRPWRTSGRIWVLFGVVALALSAIGVYGMVGYVVQQRRREIAIRLALGADPRRLIMGIGSREALAATIGLAAGSAGVFQIANTLVEPLEMTRRYSTPFVLVTNLVVMTVVIVASSVPVAAITRRPLAQTLHSD